MTLVDRILALHFFLEPVDDAPASAFLASAEEYGCFVSQVKPISHGSSDGGLLYLLAASYA